MSAVGRFCSNISRRFSLPWTLVAILSYLLIFREPIQVAQKTQKVVKNDEIASKSTEKSDVFDNYEGSGQQGDYEGAFTLSPEVYGDEDDYIANYEDAKPSTTDELLAERDVLYGKDGSPEANLDFIFHNKVPKSGSSTMKHILNYLSKRNKFALDHVRIVKFGYEDNLRLAHHIPKFRKQHPGLPYVLLKHHTFVNFTRYGMKQPTYINVVRHPVSQFASFYYFKRYGWGFAGNPESRPDGGLRPDGSSRLERRAWHGSEEEREMSVDECVQKKHKECTQAIGVISKYFCGTAPFCSPKVQTVMEQDIMKGHLAKHTDWDKVAQATEFSKKNIIRNYHTIGVLEHFDASLTLFEKAIPSIFKGAQAAYHGEYVQKMVAATKTKVNKKYNNESLAFMEEVLRYDMDIYNLCKALFYKQLSKYQIPLN